MLTIWNKTFQSLLFSEDGSSVKLALALVDNVLAVAHWWYLNGSECEEVKLPEILDNIDLVDDILTAHYRTEERCAAVGARENDGNLDYIKGLYNLTT